MRITGIICAAVFLLCLVAWPVIDYIGGRLCEPLSFPPLWPAEIVPSGIGLLVAVILLITVIRSLLARRQRGWTIGALAVIIAAAWAFRLYGPQLPGFLHGLRDRFVIEVGYPRMREFAKEVSQTGKEDIIQNPSVWGRQSQEQQKRWDDLVVRYPFLGWTHGAGSVIVRDGIVELTWGSPLTGHWGFQVAPNRKVGPVEEDRGRVLTVSKDIQFVYYFD
jgi:hypothetical protein